MNDDMMKLASQLFPINRSLTGQGNIQTLEELKRHIPNLNILGFITGSEVFDWTIPPVWECKVGTLVDPMGNIICDFSKTNLSLVGYSASFRGTLDLDDLLPHLHSIPEYPSAVPYVTSYYERNWGFCLSDKELKSLPKGEYTITIDTEFSSGEMPYGELLIPGESESEILFSTYICHPSMANNEISGPVVTTFLAKYVQSLSNRKYTYRFIFVPETIGAIAYLEKNLEIMKLNTVAGWVLTCVGDNRNFSFLESRFGTSVADQISLQVFDDLEIVPNFYSWLERGSDERQYCAPGIDLPVASIMRTKYWEYPEYHTSLDTIGGVVTSAGLSGALNVYKSLVEHLENEPLPKSRTLCEPQLGKRGLYSQISKIGSGDNSRELLNVWSFCDGQNTRRHIAKETQLSEEKVIEYLNILKDNNLVDY